MLTVGQVLCHVLRRGQWAQPWALRELGEGLLKSVCPNLLTSSLGNNGIDVLSYLKGFIRLINFYLEGYVQRAGYAKMVMCPWSCRSSRVTCSELLRAGENGAKGSLSATSPKKQNIGKIPKSKPLSPSVSSRKPFLVSQLEYFLSLPRMSFSPLGISTLPHWFIFPAETKACLVLSEYLRDSRI